MTHINSEVLSECFVVSPEAFLVVAELEDDSQAVTVSQLLQSEEGQANRC